MRCNIWVRFRGDDFESSHEHVTLFVRSTTHDTKSRELPVIFMLSSTEEHQSQSESHFRQYPTNHKKRFWLVYRQLSFVAQALLLPVQCSSRAALLKPRILNQESDPNPVCSTPVVES